MNGFQSIFLIKIWLEKCRTSPPKKYLSRFQTHRNIKSQPERDWMLQEGFCHIQSDQNASWITCLIKKMMNREGTGPQAWSEFLCLSITKECSGIRTRNIPEARGPPVRNATALMKLERTILFAIEQISELYVNLTICAGWHLNKLPSSRYHSVIKGKQLS